MELISESKIFIGEGWVAHARPSQQVNNSFRYPIYNLFLPVHEESVLKKLNRRSILSIRTQDYLNGKSGSLKKNVEDFLKLELGYSCQQIWLQTLPRIFGYAFNPVSFWYCYNKGKLDAVLCEVNNTFGDRHFYFVKDFEGAPTKVHLATKRFHVSPFFDISGHYAFEFKSDKDVSDVKIQLFENENLKLATQIKLELRPFDQVTALYLLWTYGLMTFMVIFRIHFQALKLWFKGAKFYKRPSPPKEKLTHDYSKS